MAATNSRWWRPWREAGGATVLHVDLTPDADREACAYALLDDEEKTRWRRFLAERARREFALCRTALRIALAERLGCADRALSFGYLEHGKPFARVKGRRVAIGFNVSHSGRHGLIALAAHDSLGVDVEERVSRQDLVGIGGLVYGPAERRLLTDAGESRKEYVFYRLWSMKEALIKAIGTGFSLGPSKFEIPEPMLQGERSGLFRFPHAPTESWRLLDLGEARFAAALAYRETPSPTP